MKVHGLLVAEKDGNVTVYTTTDIKELIAKIHEVSALGLHCRAVDFYYKRMTR